MACMSARTGHCLITVVSACFGYNAQYANNEVKSWPSGEEYPSFAPSYSPTVPRWCLPFVIHHSPEAVQNVKKVIVTEQLSPQTYGHHNRLFLPRRPPMTRLRCGRGTTQRCVRRKQSELHCRPSQIECLGLHRRVQTRKTGGAVLPRKYLTRKSEQ